MSAAPSTASTPSGTTTGRSKSTPSSSRMRLVTCLDYSKEVTPADYLAVAAASSAASAGGQAEGAAAAGGQGAANGAASTTSVVRGGRAQRKSKSDAISRMDGSAVAGGAAATTTTTMMATIDSVSNGPTGGLDSHGSVAPMTPESGSDDATLPPVMSLLPDTPPPSTMDVSSSSRMSSTAAAPSHGRVTRANNPISKRARLQKAPKYDVPAYDLASHHDPPGTERPFGLEECPAYRPTIEQFKDPMRYIQSISGEAAEYGICKIIPPEGWEMPFTLDTELFHFRTRLQRPSQLEATSRDRMNFLDKLYRYHKQQGDPNASVPTIDGKALDLWRLHREVTSRGGFSIVNAKNLWLHLAVLLKYDPSRAPYLKTAYEKVVKPYDDFYERVRNSPTALKQSFGAGEAPKTPTHGPLQQPITFVPPAQSMTSSSRPESASRGSSESGTSGSTPSRLAPPLELHRLDSSELKTADEVVQAHSAASKKRKRQKDAATAEPATPPAKRLTLRLKTSGPVPMTAEGGPFKKGDACEVCRSGKNATKLLLCDDCDRGFHIYCLDPPLSQVPKNEQWFCTECLINTGNDFGFEEGDEHSLYSFAKRAHAFKQDWFKRWAVHGRGKEQPTERDIEEEYWRLTSSDAQEVEVEYGADLRSAAHGSAAPVIETHPFHEASVDGWNLNNLPILPSSLLKYIRSDISGMTVPWIYVGMLFSTFCWHNEDHWTYSVNYQYWGATKTWYGIPGSHAERFEDVMRQEAPDLFEGSPGLLFDLITMMNPGKIKEAGVNVYACNQGPGEFVITFPKAYHCGFNQGLNFNEAVNFALPDWVHLGRECVQLYQKFNKPPVFSHDELLITIAQNNKTVDTARWLRPHFSDMNMREIKRRDAVDFPVVRTEDRSEATCVYCKQFCYLSQVFCDGCEKISCVDHWDIMCDHPSQLRRLRIRYTIEQLANMRRELDERAEIPTRWQMRLQALLDSSAAPDLKEIRALIAEGNKLDLLVPDMIALRPWLAEVDQWIAEASIYFERPLNGRKRVKKGSRVADDLDENSEEERFRAKRDPQGISKLLQRASRLNFRASELDQLTRLQNDIRAFNQRARGTLQREEASLQEIQELVILGRAFNVNLPILRDLTRRYNQLKWISDMEELDEAFLELSDVSGWIVRAQVAGIDSTNEYYRTLLKRQRTGQAWADKAREVLQKNEEAAKWVEKTIKHYKEFWESVQDVHILSVVRGGPNETPLSELDDLLKPDMDRPVVGEIFSNLTSLRNKAVSVQQQMRATLALGSHKPLAQVRKLLVAHASKCPSIDFPEYHSLNSISNAYFEWQDFAEAGFSGFHTVRSMAHQSNSSMTFLEFLKPVIADWERRLDPEDDFPKSLAQTDSGKEQGRFLCVCRGDNNESEEDNRTCQRCLETHSSRCFLSPNAEMCGSCMENNGSPLYLQHSICQAEHLIQLVSPPKTVDADFDEYDLIARVASLLKRALRVLLPRLHNATVHDQPFIEHWFRKLQGLTIYLGVEDPEGKHHNVFDELAVKHMELWRAIRKARRSKSFTPSMGDLRKRNQWPHFVFTKGCLCTNDDVNRKPDFPLITVKCRICNLKYHSECVVAPDRCLGSNGERWVCPKCVAGDGLEYESAKVEMQLVEHKGTRICVDAAATLVSGSDLVTHLEITATDAQPRITLIVRKFVPGKPATPGSFVQNWKPPRPETRLHKDDRSDGEEKEKDQEEVEERSPGPEYEYEYEKETDWSKVKLPPVPTPTEPTAAPRPESGDSPSARLARLLTAANKQRSKVAYKVAPEAAAAMIAAEPSAPATTQTTTTTTTTLMPAESTPTSTSTSTHNERVERAPIVPAGFPDLSDPGN